MKRRKAPILETERLRLRAFREDDLDAYAALNRDPEVLRYYPGPADPWDRGRSWRHLAFLMGHWQLGGSGSWAVELRETEAFLGVIGFSDPAAGWPGFELAWKLAPPWWGNGYATEGGRAALDYAFLVLRRDLVISVIHPDNRASIAVAARLGQTLRGHLEVQGQTMLRYGIDRPRSAAA